MEDRAPDCATARAAAIAGIIAAAVMADEMSFGSGLLPDHVAVRMPAADPSEDFRISQADCIEGFRVAGLMISARARSSVRTPSQAALSAAEAALALAEDWLDEMIGETPDLTDAHVVIAIIIAVLRNGLDPLHRAEGQAPYDAGPPAA